MLAEIEQLLLLRDLKATLNKKLLKLRNILSANCNINLQHDAGHKMNADGPDAPVE